MTSPSLSSYPAKPVALGKVRGDSGRLVFTLVYGVLVIHSLLTLFPLFWVVTNSFRESDSILRSIALLPETLDLKNYSRIFTATNIPQAFLNSLAICVISLSLLLAVALPLAYALSRFRFRVSGIHPPLLHLAILVPGVSVLPMMFTPVQRPGPARHHVRHHPDLRDRATARERVHAGHLHAHHPAMSSTRPRIIDGASIWDPVLEDHRAAQPQRHRHRARPRLRVDLERLHHRTDPAARTRSTAPCR